ncbi:hypothetical protein [Halorarum salinum]|uniref:Uncharacterized protein n=1 Tax=Halorarum salinum TaxID=2743089 RepID=A0A7D5LAS3_9EURY|nr:hypothetical protein [Halobaculum salinum]QLG62128.1 hypothetical protein HUG12_10455 [Halobaculum salinum]
MRTGGARGEVTIRGLDLGTNPEAEELRLRVDAVRRRGIEQTTLGVADTLQHAEDEMDSRSAFDSLRFYSEALRSTTSATYTSGFVTSIRLTFGGRLLAW